MSRYPLSLTMLLITAAALADDPLQSAVSGLREALQDSHRETASLRKQVAELEAEVRLLRSIASPVFVDIRAAEGVVDTGVVLSADLDYRIIWLSGKWRLGPAEPWLGPDGYGGEWSDQQPGRESSRIKVAPHGSAIYVAGGRASRLDRSTLLQGKDGPLLMGVNETNRIGADGADPLADNEGSLRFLILPTPAQKGARANAFDSGIAK